MDTVGTMTAYSSALASVGCPVQGHFRSRDREEEVAQDIYNYIVPARVIAVSAVGTRNP